MNQWQTVRQRIEEQEHRRAEKATEKARKYEARAIKSARRKGTLAERINDEAMLIAGLCFWVEKLRQPLSFTDFQRIVDGTPRKMRRHLRAARRILGVDADAATNSFTLPKTWRTRLFRILDLDVYPDSDASVEFARLRADLVIDDVTRSFALRYPVLERARAFLRAGLTDHSEPERPSPFTSSSCARSSQRFSTRPRSS